MHVSFGLVFRSTKDFTFWLVLDLSWLDDDEPSDGGCPTVQRSIPRRDFPPNRSDRTSWKDRFFSRFSVQIHLGVDRFRGKKGPRSVEECERTTRRSPPTHHVRLQWEGTKKTKKREANLQRLSCHLFVERDTTRRKGNVEERDKEDTPRPRTDRKQRVERTSGAFRSKKRNTWTKRRRNDREVEVRTTSST